MFKKTSFAIIGVSVGMLFISPISHAENKITTVEETTTQVVTPRTSKKTIPEHTTTTSNTSVTTTKEAEPRQVLSEDTLKRISNTLCTQGFKSYVGTDKKNICQSKVVAPDIAYSCVWDKKGTAAYAPTTQGPCSLDFTEHRGSILITKNDFASKPPLSYGTEAQCCYRAAQGPISSN